MLNRYILRKIGHDLSAFSLKNVDVLMISFTAITKYCIRTKILSSNQCDWYKIELARGIRVVGDKTIIATAKIENTCKIFHGDDAPSSGTVSILFSFSSDSSFENVSCNAITDIWSVSISLNWLFGKLILFLKQSRNTFSFENALELIGIEIFDKKIMFNQMPFTKFGSWL